MHSTIYVMQFYNHRGFVPTMSLIGRIAFVTGAGSGIGKATSQILAREGASVIAADINYKSAEETVKTLDSEPSRSHLAVNLDVGKSSSIKDALKTALEKYSKPPTIIVNSAGITRDNFALKLSEEDFDEVLRINLKGTFMVTQIFANSIIEHGLGQNASIVNISSFVGKHGNIGQSNYSASKAGVVAFTKTTSKEFGKFGIRINAILPGIIDTPIVQTVPDKVKDIFVKMTPLGRLGKPEEIGETIAFLASDKSSFISGAAIDVTGGL